MNRREEADLHMHTTASDGLHEPAYNVETASKLGLKAIAITDHDTVAGVERAQAASLEWGVEIVPGVEISTNAEGKDIHVLGYFVDTNDETFLKRLEYLRSEREARNDRIFSNLQKLGIAITMEDVLHALDRPLKQDESIGRPHIADALVSKGYVRSRSEAFEFYLAKGKPGYSSSDRITPAEAASWIREAGGVAVLAHPGIYGGDDLVETILTSGFDGIEAYHSDHSEEQERSYARLAERLGLIATAGSDFHGTKHGETIHAAIGARRIGYEAVERMKRLSRTRGKEGRPT